MSDRFSVAAPVRSWRGAFLILFVLVTVAKVVIASSLSPFSDEAFYWQESLRPAWGYSDLPPLTAWLIAASEACFGHGLLAMRLPFLVLGALLPWQVGAIAARYTGGAARWQASMFPLLLPLAGSLGVMAMPDVPLTFGILLAVHGLLAALDDDRLRDWLVVGLGLAIVWSAHYRAAMPMLAGLLLLTFAPRGRAAWRRPGLWLAMAVAAIGLVPLIVYNLQAHGAGIAFQLVDRNPWQFHADALVQPLEQAFACTPIVWAAMLWAMWQCWRRRASGPFDVFAFVGGGFIVLYFVLGLFADNLRFRLHWPLPGYLVLAAVLPPLLAESSARWRRVAYAGLALAGLGLAIGLGNLGLAASADGARMLTGSSLFPANFTGWRESAAAVRARLVQEPDAIVVADNFILAAELRFELGGSREVYSLDSPLNVKHGRAPQLAAWGLDEAGLARHAGKAVLLVVDENASRERERQAWLASLCSRVDVVEPVGRVDRFDGRRRFALYDAVARSSRAVREADPCIVLVQAREAASPD